MNLPNQFNQDLDNLFHYIEYLDVFGSDGSIDASKILLRMTFGPNETVDFSLSDLIAYLKLQGYQLNEDFYCTKVSAPSEGSGAREGYIDWSASEPDKRYTYIVPGMRRTTLEESALEIMEILHRYYTTYNRLIAGPSNLHFKIEYLDPKDDDSVLYTNDPDLTADSVKAFGKYAYLPGNSVFYDTNFNSIALTTVSSLSASNPFDGNDFFLLAGVDTAYPVRDIYSEGRAAYLQMQNRYITGFVLLVAGGIIALITLLFLLNVSGHRENGERTITLHGFDTTSTEMGVLLFGLLTVFFTLDLP